MKNTLSTFKLGAVALFAMAGCSFGVTYSLTTGTGNTVTGIGDSSGDGFQGDEGIVSLGVYSSSDFQNFTTDDFVTNFTAFGTPDSTNFNAPGLFGNNGVFSLSTIGQASNAPFVGQAMVALVGNAASFAAATEFLVLDLARTFLAADDAVPTPIEIRIDETFTVLFGDTVANIPTQGSDGSINPGFVTKAIPEPSALLLSAFGVLGLLRRKR
ncbi:MAG: PEP-CTERM sorting domain-containing protein [Luteolibacter sp.]